MYLKLGQYPECETDCDAILRQYERSQCVDLGLVRVLVLAATVHRQKTQVIYPVNPTYPVNQFYLPTLLPLTPTFYISHTPSTHSSPTLSWPPSYPPLTPSLPSINPQATPASYSMEGLMRGLDHLRRACAIADSLARDMGFLGSDSNVTYERAHTALLTTEATPPVLHNLTDEHVNRAALTLRTSVNAQVYHAVQFL